MLLYPLWFIDVISNIPHTQQNKSRRTEDKDPGCLLQMMRNRKPWDSSHSNRTEGFVQSQSVRYNKNSSVQIDVVTLKHTSQTTKIFSTLTFLRSLFSPIHQKSVLYKDLFIDLALVDVIFTWEDVLRGLFNYHASTVLGLQTVWQWSSRAASGWSAEKCS